MSFKDKITSFLFRSKPGGEPDEPLHAEEEPQFQAAPEPPPPAADPSLLEIPADHPIRNLYDLWRSEEGQAPPLRLCMDEDGVLSQEVLDKEKNRLQSSLKSLCTTRWKTAKGRSRGKHSKKKEEEAEEEAVILDARPWIHISSDKLYAWMLVLPPVGGGEELSRDMLYRTLSDQNISYGLDQALADRLPHGRDRYFSLHLIARGKPAFDGRNGNIVDYFPRVVERVLEVNEFGQVDYTSLNLISNVEEGQEICRLIRPTEGEPGVTVQGQEVPAKSGVSVPLPMGRNTEASEDGEALLAAMPGHVEFTGRSFQVKPVMDIDGNVDFSTGNIKFVGDVNIKGDVLSGFSVKAMGNVYVGGAVESGSVVESGGDLTVVKGILGDGTTAIRSSRCIFAKYIENAVICVKENLQTDCIVNSKIYCDGEVVVRSGRGSIMGGKVWAGKKVDASIVGAKSEIRTAVTLGGLPCASFERERLQRKMSELNQELERLENQPDNSAKSSLMGKARMKLSVTEHKLNQLEEELAESKPDAKETNSGRMECGIAYAGTELRFGDIFLRLRHEYQQCTAKLVCDEIVLI